MKAQAAVQPGAKPARPPSGPVARITGLALAHPQGAFTQQQVVGLLGLEDDEFARRVFARGGIEHRRLHLTRELAQTPMQGRTAAVEEQLLELAMDAIASLGVDVERVGTLITASLYSLGCPTLAHRLIERLPMDQATDKYHITGVGCASAVPLVRLASQAVQSHSGRPALIVAAESMSGLLAAATPDDPRSKTIGSSLFGDGCAAMLIESLGGEAESELSTHNGAGANGAARPVSASDRAANGAAGDVGASAGPCVLASKVHQIPGTLDAVTIELAAADGHLQMIKELPDVAGAHLAELVNSFLAGEGLTPEAIDHWLVHPGGRRILESAQSALELSDEQMRVSFDVLAKYGNVGTPSIFYVVHETIERRRPAPGEQGLMVTIGPGVTVGLMLLRW